MEQFGKILVMSFTVVSLYDIIKSFYSNRKVDINSIATAIIGVILSVLAQLDLFSLVGINFLVPYVGQVLTGFIISKGANYIFDFITKILKLLSGNTDVLKKEVITESVKAPEEASEDNKE